MDNKEEMVSVILEALEKNLKIVVPFNSKQFSIAVEKMVLEKYPAKK